MNVVLDNIPSVDIATQYGFYHIQISMNVHHRLHVNRSVLIFLAVFSAPVILDMYWTATEGPVEVCFITNYTATLYHDLSHTIELVKGTCVHCKRILNVDKLCSQARQYHNFISDRENICFKLQYS